MKDKIIRAIAIAVVSVISAALVAYLKNPENREQVQKVARQYQRKFQKTARKATKKLQLALE